MKRIRRLIPCVLWTVAVVHISAFARLKAFPTAEGYGRFATGGRGGEVYVVTNLNNAGAGSLRDACENRTFFEGNVVPRTVVFNVSGTIELDCGDRGLNHLRINEPFLTIAGQSAPGAGICIVNERDDGSDERTQQKPIVAINTSDIIVRHIRIRNQSEHVWVNPNGCCPYESFGCVRIPAWGEAQGGDISDIIVDHCSMSWASDDIYWTGSGSTNSTSNITLQYCLFYEAFHHGRAGMMSYKTTSGTFFRNVVGNAIKRNIQVQSMHTAATCGLINNIVYNWRTYGTTVRTRESNGVFYTLETNVLSNYWIPGPESGSGDLMDAMAIFSSSATPADPLKTRVYVDDGNIGPTRTSTAQEPWDIMTMRTNPSEYTDCSTSFQSTTRLDAANLPPDSVIETDVKKLHDLLLGTSRTGAGAFPWSRDRADRDFIREMRERKGSSLGESTVPQYPAIAEQTHPADYDTDNDGMADVWEDGKGLNPDVADHNGLDLHSEYTNLEIFLHSLAGDITSEPEPPTVTFTQPTQPVVTEPAYLGVVAEATAPGGSIDNVKLYLDDTFVRQKNNAPYEWGTASATASDSALLGLAEGTYTLRVTATDTNGRTASDTMEITVEPAAVGVRGDALPLSPVSTKQATRVFDLRGRRVVRESVSGNRRKDSHAMNAQTHGVFIVRPHRYTTTSAQFVILDVRN